MKFDLADAKMSKVFSIKDKSYWCHSFVLHVPFIPGLPWPYKSYQVYYDTIENLRPSDVDVFEEARKALKKSWVPGSWSSKGATFKII